MKATRLIKALLVLAMVTVMAVQKGFSAGLEQQFQTPGQAQPWVYWVWLADTTPAALTRDLEQMKAKGITGCILYDVRTGRGVNWWQKTVVRDGGDYRAVNR